MAKKNSAVLWTVGQSLEKGDKEQARHNMGISFESSTTLTTKTLTFVDNIKENATTGDLTFTKNTVLVDESIDSTSDHPVRNSAIATALNNLKTFYATQSTTFDQLKTAYDAGQTLVFINDGHAYQLGWVNKNGNTPVTFEFSNPYLSLTREDKNEGKVYDTFLRLGAWSCKSSSGWSQAITPQNVVCQDYADYRVGALQTSDVAIATGDKLVISDSSDHGKGVRSEIAFDTTASETSFLNQRGAWNTALPTYTESTDPLASNYWDTLSGTKFYTIKSSPTPAADNTSPEEGNMFALTGELDRGSGNKYKVQLAMGDKLYYRHTTGTAGTTWSDWITLNEYSAGIDLKLTGTEFAVNTTSTMDVYSKDSQCFTIGQNCETEHAGPSFIGGFNSKLYGGSNSFIFGDSNIAGDTPTINQETNISSYKNFSSAFIVGSENRLFSSDLNFIWGTENTISSTTDVFNNNGYNIVFGSSNMLGGGQHNILIGVNNWLSQDSTTHVPSNVIMIGHDLHWKKSDGHDVAIFGRFNLKDDYRYNNGLAGTPLRITGCGLTDDNRANIEELYSSGTLWLKQAVETSCVVGDTTYANGIYIDYTNGSGGVNSTKSYSETATRSGVEFSRTFSHFTYMSPTSIGLSDVKEVKVISPEGSVAPETSRLHNVQFVSITHGSDDEYELVNGMPSRAVALEYKSAFLGSSGISLGEPKMPAWNTDIASNCETSWLTIFGNRTYAPSSLPWDDSQTKPGNLKLGKLAVKYFLDTDLQVDTTQNINNAIIPGEQVGELTFIVGTSNYGFWIHDDYYTDSTQTATYIPDPGGIGSTHLESRYIRQNTFCILMTTKPTVWNKNVNPPVITQFGEFKALVSSNF